MDYGAWAQGSWDRTPDLWENQGSGLTVGRLLEALQTALEYRAGWSSLPILIEGYDGSGERTRFAVAEIGLTGKGDDPSGIVLTVIPG